jgi:hypothetical protein
MEAAAEKIGAVYRDLGRGEEFRAQFYDAPHQFNIAMQEDAFEWLKKSLAPNRTTGPASNRMSHDASTLVR